MISEVFDVAVVGGGPAGCAAAISLQKLGGMKVVILEASEYSTGWPGQAISASVLPLLDYLSVKGVLTDSCHLPSYTIQAAWGGHELVTQESVFSAEGNGWHLERAAFDRSLACAARNFGVRVYTGVHVSRALATDGGWKVTASGRGKRCLQLSARFVIDSTGSKAAFARSRGARRRIDDRLLAAGAIFQHTHDSGWPACLQVESAEAGWWYSASLPSGRDAVVFMSDASTLRTMRMTSATDLLREARKTNHLKQRLRDAVPSGHLLVRPAYSGLLEPIGGENWLAAGDAVASFDPLSSLGIGHAIYSGIQAARTISSMLAGHPAAFEEYRAGVISSYGDYQRVRKKLYLREQRWGEENFWRRRQFAA